MLIRKVVEKNGPSMLKDEMVRQGEWLFARRSFLPLLVLPFGVDPFLNSNWINRSFGTQVAEIWEVSCLFLAMIGLGLRVATVGCVPAATSRRSTRQQQADVLNTTGLYSLMRHPLYVGNFLIFIGLVSSLNSAMFILAAAVAFLLYYERIVSFEEQFLEEMHGGHYRDWAARTPAFIPRLETWSAPTLRFSWRSALLREFHGLFLIGTVFLVVRTMQSTLLEHRTMPEVLGERSLWLFFFVFSAIVYLTVLVIKKRTRWLVVAGR
jgi:protein-S-isoprenylcysteine O-methyltransferase Ste14